MLVEWLFGWEEVPSTAQAMETIEELGNIFKSLDLDKYDSGTRGLPDATNDKLKTKKLEGALN
jgi:hypothetical protein